MPKAKLKIKKSEGKKFKTSAMLNGLTVGAAKPVGDIILTEVTYSNIQQVYDTAIQQPDLKGDELDEKEKADK